MAVNVGQRNVPDTQSNRVLIACDKALDLAQYTIEVCSNPKKFDPQYQDVLTNDLVKYAKDIYIKSWQANNIRVGKDGQGWELRSNLQLEAISLCANLLATLNLAKRIFHIKNKRMVFWIGNVVEVRDLLKKWHDGDVKRYSKDKK